MREGEDLGLTLDEAFLPGLKGVGGMRLCICCGAVFSARQRG
ncbi:hypothetical protein [Synechococcus sp. J7-Johnson]|nr:hypothetical protein [Synechococcus sp. J7-Johnson]